MIKKVSETYRAHKPATRKEKKALEDFYKILDNMIKEEEEK